MNNFDKAEAIEDLYHCHDKRDLAKMVVELQGDIQEMVAKAAANKLDGYRELSERACKAEEELARCQRMYANACATLGEIQGYLGNDIVGIEPALVKQLINERDALAAHVVRLRQAMTNRKAGWHWVKFGDWQCALWEHDSWQVLGVDDDIYDDDLDEIGPRILTPDKPWQCVPVKVTQEMMEVALETYMPFGDLHLAIQAAIACASKPTEGG